MKYNIIRLFLILLLSVPFLSCNKNQFEGKYIEISDYRGTVIEYKPNKYLKIEVHEEYQTSFSDLYNKEISNSFWDYMKEEEDKNEYKWKKLSESKVIILNFSNFPNVIFKIIDKT